MTIFIRFPIFNVPNMSLSSSFNQDGNFMFEHDLSKDKYDACVGVLEKEVINLSNDKFKWPAFKTWFRLMFQDSMPNFNLAEFFELDEIFTDISDMTYFGSLLMMSIKKHFSRDVYKFVETYTNLKFYFKLNSDLNEISFMDKLTLMDRMFIKGGKNMEEVATRIGTAKHFLPEDLTFLTFCYHLPRKEAYNFFRSIATSKDFDGHGLDTAEICHKYYKYKADNPWTTAEEVNQVTLKNIKPKNVRCYKCGKKGHLKHQCKARHEENNHVIGLFGDDAHENDEMEQAYMLEVDDGLIEDEEDRAEMEHHINKEVSREAVFITENKTFSNKSYATEFILDTGATTHIVNNLEWFDDVRSDPTVVKTIQGQVKANTRGNVTLPNGIVLTNAVYLENIQRNIISVSKLVMDGYSCFQEGKHGNYYSLIVKDGCTYMRVPMKNMLFAIGWKNMNMKKEKCYMSMAKVMAHGERTSKGPHVISNAKQSDGWLDAHKAFGHASKNQMKTAGYKQMGNCLTCDANVTKTTGTTDTNHYKVGEMIQADVITSMYKSNCAIYSDRCTKFIIGYVVDSRSKVSECTVQALKTFRNLASIKGYNICYFRADNEFDTKAINHYCNAEGIITQFTAPHSSYQNGGAENINKMVKHKIRLMMMESGLDKSFWTFAFRHVLFILNYIPRNNETQSAWTKLTGRTKTLANMIPFGCLTFYYNYENDQKIFTKQKSGVFVGYDQTTKVAQVYNPIDNTIIRTSAFHGIKDMFPLQKPHWYDGLATDDDEVQTQNHHTHTEFDSEDHCSADEDPISSSRIGTYGGSFASMASHKNSGMSPSSKPGNTSSARDNPDNTEQDVIMKTTERDEGSEYDPSTNDTEFETDILTEVDESNTDGDISEPSKQEPSDLTDSASERLWNNKSKERKLPTDSNGESRHEDNVSDKIMVEEPSASHYATQYEQAVHWNRIQNEQARNLFGHYNQLLKNSTDLLNLSRQTSQGADIPNESGILPKPKNTPRQQLLTGPNHTNNKRTDVLMQHHGHSKRRIHENDTISINSTAPDGTSKNLSTLKSKTYLNLQAPERNLSNTTDRSSFYPVISSNQHLKGGQDHILSPEVSKYGNNNYQDKVIADEINVLVDKLKYRIPETLTEALRTPQAKQWLRAAEKEYNSMLENNVFTLVKRSNIPKNALVVQSRWVFSVKNVKVDDDTSDIKSQEEFKARIVAKGFTQEKGVNYVDKYSPVMRYENFRLVLAIAAMAKWELRQLDAKNAFLNGKLDYEVFLKPPTGTTKQSGYVWKLDRSLYGLKQSPRIWFLTIEKVLLDNGFKSSILEPCMFWKTNCIMLIYVDDILIAGKDKKTRDAAADILKKYFVMKDMGKPRVFLGMTIHQLNNNEGYLLNMEDTLDKMEKDHNVEPCQRKLNTPIVKGFDKNEIQSKPLNEHDHRQYRSIVGLLLFIANTVRLDIAFAVSYLSRMVDKPTEHHMKGARRTVQYLVQTKQHGLIFKNRKFQLPYKDFRYLDKTGDVIIQDYAREGQYKIQVFSDADWAGDITDRKSQSGSIVLLNGNIIDWSSRKQDCVASSTAESEYIALSDAVKTGQYFKNILKEMMIDVKYINAICDNCSANTLAAHNTLHKKTKHIDIRYHYIRSLVDRKLVKLNYVNTKDNIADVLTKFIDPQTFQHLNELMKK